MHASRFSRPVREALGLMVVVALALTSPGCGGGVGDQPGAAAPKERPTVTAKDSMNEYLKSHAQAQAHRGRRK